MTREEQLVEVTLSNQRRARDRHPVADWNERERTHLGGGP